MRLRGRRSAFTLVALVAAAAAALAGCPDEDGDGSPTCDPSSDFCVEDAPRLELTPAANAPLEISDTALAPGEAVLRDVRVTNTGTGLLTLESVELSYTPPVGVTDDMGPAFELLPLVVDLPFGVHPFDGPDFPQGANVTIRYTKQ
ncbi:MAG: hypothetical protein CSA66_00550, partial [Proteobacteria bacterium]